MSGLFLILAAICLIAATQGVQGTLLLAAVFAVGGTILNRMERSK